jgi:hypothetical protein
VERPGLETIVTLLSRDLRVAGDRYSLEIGPPPRHISALLGPPSPDAVIAFSADGMVCMWLHFWRTDDWLEELASAIDQVQDEVMEHETELWPECPLHRHSLTPRPRDGRVVWECMDTDQVFAELGALPDSFAI